MNRHQDELKKQAVNLLPESQKLFGRIVYLMGIFVGLGALLVPVLILANPSANVLNPNTVFGAIFAGETPAAIWGYTEAGVFPGPHFYLSNLGAMDSWAMMVIVVGCVYGLFGLIPAAGYQLTKEKDRMSALFGIAVAVLIVLSAVGVLRMGG